MNKSDKISAKFQEIRERLREVRKIFEDSSNARNYKSRNVYRRDKFNFDSSDNVHNDRNDLNKCSSSDDELIGYKGKRNLHKNKKKYLKDDFIYNKTYMVSDSDLSPIDFGSSDIHKKHSDFDISVNEVLTVKCPKCGYSFDPKNLSDFSSDSSFEIYKIKEKLDKYYPLSDDCSDVLCSDISSCDLSDFVLSDELIDSDYLIDSFEFKTSKRKTKNKDNIRNKNSTSVSLKQNDLSKESHKKLPSKKCIKETDIYDSKELDDWLDYIDNIDKNITDNKSSSQEIKSKKNKKLLLNDDFIGNSIFEEEKFEEKEILSNDTHSPIKLQNSKLNENMKDNKKKRKENSNNNNNFVTEELISSDLLNGIEEEDMIDNKNKIKEKENSNNHKKFVTEEVLNSDILSDKIEEDILDNKVKIEEKENSNNHNNFVTESDLLNEIEEEEIIDNKSKIKDNSNNHKNFVTEEVLNSDILSDKIEEDMKHSKDKIEEKENSNNHKNFVAEKILNSDILNDEIEEDIIDNKVKIEKKENSNNHNNFVTESDILNEIEEEDTVDNKNKIKEKENSNNHENFVSEELINSDLLNEIEEEDMVDNKNKIKEKENSNNHKNFVTEEVLNSDILNEKIEVEKENKHLEKEISLNKTFKFEEEEELPNSFLEKEETLNSLHFEEEEEEIHDIKYNKKQQKVKQNKNNLPNTYEQMSLDNNFLDSNSSDSEINEIMNHLNAAIQENQDALNKYKSLDIIMSSDDSN